MACCNKHTGQTLVIDRPHIWVEPQCLECIEKHVAKSMCVAEQAIAIAREKKNESYDGYPSRYKIIGNLSLAEEHSVKWPELHKAIRRARKEFQVKNIMPNWNLLAKLCSDAIKLEEANNADG